MAEQGYPGYEGGPGGRAFVAEPGRHGYEGEPSRPSYEADPARRGYEAEQGGPGYEAEPGAPGQAPPSAWRGGRGRLRRRGSVWFWSAIALAVAGLAVVIFALTYGGGKSAAGPQPGALVTAFLPGELQRVPTACAAVSATLLDQYLPGRSKPVAAQPLEGAAASQCSWSVDRPRQYRFMEVAIEAYGPSGLASGNGSATQAAADAFVQARVAKLFPPPKSHEPKATVVSVPGLGQAAFSATQRYQRGGAIDMVTLVARYHNILVTVIFEARVGGPGVDPFTFLAPGARSVAGAVLAKLA